MVAAWLTAYPPLTTRITIVVEGSDEGSQHSKPPLEYADDSKGDVLNVDSVLVDEVGDVTQLQSLPDASQATQAVEQPPPPAPDEGDSVIYGTPTTFITPSVNRVVSATASCSATTMRAVIAALSSLQRSLRKC